MDSSKFSLEKAEEVLKPHIGQLPFKRLGDYAQNLSTKVVVNGITYNLQLWERFTTITSDMRLECHAYGVLVGRRIFVAAGEVKPFRIEHDWLIILRPGGGSMSWAFQKIKFTPERHSTSYYEGKSQIGALDSENFGMLVRDLPNVNEKFWGQVSLWIMRYRTEREEALVSTNVLYKKCCEQYSCDVTIPQVDSVVAG